MTGIVKNAEGEELASFADERWAGIGFFGGDPVGLVRRCMSLVGKDVARMIHTGEYRTAENH